MWSEEAMELRDVSLLNLILAGRRTSAPASAKHEDHHTEWATQGPLVFAMFRFKVSRSNRRRNQYMFARLRVLHVKTVYVFTRVCVCVGVMFWNALFLSSSLLQLPPLACWVSVRTFHRILECEFLCGSANISAAKPELWNLFKQSPCCQGWHPRRVGDSPRSAVNICRPCCGEAFELPVKAVALGINEEDTINTLILYSNIVSLYIYIYIYIDISRESQKED